MRVAYWTSVAPDERRLPTDVARLATALSRIVEVVVFVDGAVDAPVADGVAFQDARGEHYRNLLAGYDACIYDVGPGGVGDSLREPVAAWPGLVVMRGDDVDAPFRGDRDFRRRVLDRATAVVADSERVAALVRAEHPWTPLAVAGPKDEIDRVAATCVDRLRSARDPRRWLEPSLEAAAAEIPGFVPGDPSAPWRAEIDELARGGTTRR